LRVEGDWSSDVCSSDLFELFIRDLFSTNNIVKTVRAQQSIRDSKFGRDNTRPRVLHGPWRGVP
jgi:hypothetical protein